MCGTLRVRRTSRQQERGGQPQRPAQPHIRFSVSHATLLSSNESVFFTRVLLAGAMATKAPACGDVSWRRRETRPPALHPERVTQPLPTTVEGLRS
ncbi:Hypothetical protein A7982_06318 [Minicystis rosea]|nr:Hypothetical protein A7982_06318 [Minicystis rosea]